VPIYYESRLAKLDINREEIDALNKNVDEVIENEEDVNVRENTKGKRARLSKFVGAEDRVRELAADLVDHYETRTSVLEGKAMFVAMSRDMWLTGFDAPCCHTMYVDKPMVGHNLMQAIARVNRVFKGKEGGLVVDYIGIAAELKIALKTYTQAKEKGKLTLNAEIRLEHLEMRKHGSKKSMGLNH
jgi:type I site-specific restriction-modification system R (restriction) subunit